MTSSSPFLIYSASAGSGKTYTLVKEYLKVLLKRDNLDHFKHILAITFTNKAAGEMKSRILEKLKVFSNTVGDGQLDSMLLDISNEIGQDQVLIQEKSAQLLKYIVYNYSAFNVSTIDGFTHKLIRTFSHDLKVPMDFEVEMDVDQLLGEAVDALIAKAGIDKSLTPVLVDFAIEKADEDKSWNIAYDLNKIAKLLLGESDLEHVEKLKGKNPEDFKILKQFLKEKIERTKEELIGLANKTLEFIASCGLEPSHFYSSYYPKLLQKVSEGNFEVNFEVQWINKFLNGEQLYTAKQAPEICSIIDSIHSELARVLMQIKQLIFQLEFYRVFYKNITPLSVLHAINNELKLLKEDQNKLLISEFNNLISKEIKDQPTPFIYERLGEKFSHFFIDEFQDTSVKQWDNLQPLLSNPLDNRIGSVLLVGDAKQAIYRWRGGKAEQFLDLANSERDSPFQAEKNIANLPANFRSHQTIVEFNNGLFDFLAKGFFDHSDYSNLYTSAKQEVKSLDSGFVSLEFLELQDEDSREEAYCIKTLDIILANQKKGFEFGEICVLVRKNKEGIVIADYLNDQGIPVISSESLLLINSPEVSFVIDFLTWMVQQDNKEAQVDWLYYLSQQIQPDAPHQFIQKFINESDENLFEKLQALGFDLDYSTVMEWPLFEMTEDIIRCFKLHKTSNAYLQYFLDVVFEFSESKSSDLPSFLEYFEEKKDKLSIVTPVDQNAVQIMTIHKSKGLEFPVVIFPFADLEIYREQDPKEWYPLDTNTFFGFEEGLLSFNTSMKEFGDVGEAIYTRHRAEQQLDNINLLYVALTRAEEQLYVISKQTKVKSRVDDLKSYADIFVKYLEHLNEWDEGKLVYTFGTPERFVKSKSELPKKVKALEFISVSRKDHQLEISTKSGMLWDSNQEKALEKGNLVHKLLANIRTIDDLDFIFAEFNEMVLSDFEKEELLTQLREIIFHPQLQKYFEGESIKINERDILSTSGAIYRPDRLVIDGQRNATIIDYKTGKALKKHDQQLLSYEKALGEMGIKTEKKILVYINEEIEIKEF
ncbi:UvrD-helicase domain-containing protein [Mangrovimonas sp. CR14]|uniref:UvrD-helicase domain-containing protein n=1 Tax=Mangrovimonas sp. CR14 TaxID=2706120 RepID=UPI00141E4E9C|nr:UvrD-helicase domain-containing protein [Mangrovimonas sp. CR14]NIK90979.1 UvrD-helicase domain-containing protein [Mangrovimonas sp. CR14]